MLTAASEAVRPSGHGSPHVRKSQAGGALAARGGSQGRHGNQTPRSRRLLPSPFCVTEEAGLRGTEMDEETPEVQHLPEGPPWAAVQAVHGTRARRPGSCPCLCVSRPPSEPARPSPPPQAGILGSTAHAQEQGEVRASRRGWGPRPTEDAAVPAHAGRPGLSAHGRERASTGKRRPWLCFSQGGGGDSRRSCVQGAAAMGL